MIPSVRFIDSEGLHQSPLKWISGAAPNGQGQGDTHDKRTAKQQSWTVRYAIHAYPH